MKILVTSGGTKIPIDRVRHIQNMSSGTFGSKIALEALRSGNEVTFLKADHSKSPFFVEVDVLKDKTALQKIHEANADAILYGYKYSELVYQDFDSYFSQLHHLLTTEHFDVVILAAAVSDYGVENYLDGKIRSKDSDMIIKLKALPKIISQVKLWNPKVFLVGFKLLVDSTDKELVEAARKSIEVNQCDLVVANDLRDIKENDHRIHIVTKNHSLMNRSKKEDPNFLARCVVDWVKFLKDKK